MYAIRRGAWRAPSKLQALVKISLFKSSSPAAAAAENSEDSQQIKKRLRQQRRAAAANLKSWTEESFGTGPQYFSDIAPRSAKPSESNTEKKEGGEEEDEDDDAAMWNQVLSQCRSKKERARVQRMWKMWKEHRAASSSSSQNEEHESMKTQKTSSSGKFDFQSHFADHHHHQQSWQDEYESFWTFNPSSSTESRQSEQKQRGNNNTNDDDNYNWFNFSNMNTKQPPPLPPQLNTSTRESLALLGLENCRVLPTMASLKIAFRKMALQHHPDRCLEASAKSAAEKRFKELQAAFQLIQAMVT